MLRFYLNLNQPWKSRPGFMTPVANKNRWLSPPARPLMPADDLPCVRSALACWGCITGIIFDGNVRVKIKMKQSSSGFVSSLQWNQSQTESTLYRILLFNAKEYIIFNNVMQWIWDVTRILLFFYMDLMKVVYNICIRARIFKRLRSPGIDVKESISPGWESIPVLLKRFTNSGSVMLPNLYLYFIFQKFIPENSHHTIIHNILYKYL